MIIAIATNDRISIAKRTGRAKEFAFFTIENNEIINTEYQKNTHEHHDHDRDEGHHRSGHGHGHGHHHSHDEHTHDEVVEQLKAVNMFLVRAVGKNMKRDLDKGGIPYTLVKGELVTEILSNYLQTLV